MTPANLKERIKERLAFDDKEAAENSPQIAQIRGLSPGATFFVFGGRYENTRLTAELEPLLVEMAEALMDAYDTIPYGRCRDGVVRPAIMKFENWLEAKGGKGE